MTKQMTERERNYQELKDMLLNLKAQADLKVLMSDDVDCSFAYIITERDTVLSISPDHFWGYRVTYKYKPSRQHGQGAACATPGGEDRIEYINTPEELEALERSGINFADELGASHYPNATVFLNGLWNRNQLVEL